MVQVLIDWPRPQAVLSESDHADVGEYLSALKDCLQLNFV